MGPVCVRRYLIMMLVMRKADSMSVSLEETAVARPTTARCMGHWKKARQYGAISAQYKETYVCVIKSRSPVRIFWDVWIQCVGLYGRDRPVMHCFSILRHVNQAELLGTYCGRTHTINKNLTLFII